MTKALICDLDNCLSAADEAGEQLLEPVLEAIRQTHHGRFSDRDLPVGVLDCAKS